MRGCGLTQLADEMRIVTTTQLYCGQRLLPMGMASEAAEDGRKTVSCLEVV